MGQVYRFTDENGQVRLFAEIDPSPAFTGALHISDENANPALALYNDTFDSDPNDPVFAVAVNDGGTWDLLGDGTTVALSWLVTFLRANGALVLRNATAPADNELSLDDCALWFDPTNGASKLMIKAKSTNGTVVTGSVTLA